MAFTKEQQTAIDLEGNNIIVSAGAGSGKTAVLTERVKRKILDGIHVNELLVLTFTNAAAAEMKERIRKVIAKTPELHDEMNLIDGAYITTFDSFSLSMVKKYHTRLNITNQPKITEEIIIDLKKKEILNEIFEQKYLNQTESFKQLINDFCHKEDKKLKEYILNCYKKIELKYDKTSFLKNYFLIFNNEKQEFFIKQYLKIIKEKQNTIKSLMSELTNYFEDSFIIKIEDGIKKVLNATNYEEFLEAMDYEMPRTPPKSDPKGKSIKDEISDILKELKETYLVYSNEQAIKDELESTKTNTKEIIDILIELDEKIDTYKLEKEVFSFNDISRLAIKVVEENEDIREDLTASFQEIMIDEYQDTSDTQEKFISLISKNNVYMVGDIKQSIYRFRNANPEIFKNKYETYKETDKGEAIDLLKNFRSRDEVLSDVNLLFDNVMDKNLGGADYQVSHRMVFGNDLYTTNKKDEQNYHIDVITYDKSSLEKLTPAIEEAFVIARDIKEKVENKYQVFDKDEKCLRDCKYSDFVVLLDRSTNFNLYKNIFEYHKIPMTILKEESFKKDNDAYIFKNLLKLLIHINKHNLDNEFKYAFVSISRSYLYRISDEEIYSYFINNNYQESKLYKDLEEIGKDIDYETPSMIIRKLIDKIDYETKLLNISNIKANRIRCEYFYKLIKDYELNGKTLYDFIEYLDNIFESENNDLKFNINSETSNSCMIMTIHKSKGLEYPVCYFAGFASPFNFAELKERIIFDNEYGLILPKVDNNYKDTILKILLKRRTRLDEISEKIRLLYVAVTRAREKMIIIIPSQEEENEVQDIIPMYIREKYNSFLSIMKSIYTNLLPYIKETSTIANRDFQQSIKKDKLESPLIEKINVEELNIETKEIITTHYSKDELHIITEDEKDKMEFGTKVHEILEELDFKNPTLLDEIKNSYIKRKINAFLESDLIKTRINNNMYKEYEFIYKIDETINHGIIDLLIEDEKEMTIIDYKLKNIDDKEYDKQLNGYRQYIENKTSKKTRCFLYSIIDETYREVEE